MAAPEEVSMVEGTDKPTISITKDGVSTKYSIGDIISFKSNDEDKIGKIANFGIINDAVIGIYYYVLDDSDEDSDKWKWLLVNEAISLSPEYVSDIDWSTMKVVRPPQNGGRRRKHRRRPTRKVRRSRHRKTRKY